MIDPADVLEPGGDRVRLGEIEPDTSGVAADFLRGSLRAGLISAGHDDVAPVVRVRLRELAAETLRSADDDDVSRLPCSPFAGSLTVERTGPMQT